MPVFEINANGKTYEVTAPSREAAMQAFAGTMDAPAALDAPAAAPEPDKYQRAALEDRATLKAKGLDTSAGLARLGIQGATFNTADEILAGLSTPLEMFKRGTWNPAEGYRYAKASEDLSLAGGRDRAGLLGTGAEIIGGAGSGLGLARGGITAGRWLGQNAGLIPRSAAAAADAGAFGALAGAGEGNALDERLGNAAFGGGVGLGVGAGTPGLLKLLGMTVSPITSNVRALLNPENYARNQVARAIMEGNAGPRQLADEVVQAAREGQAGYTVADALGNPGQRMLSTVTRAPGPGRTDTIEFLDARQAGQGRRVANTLAEGFDSPRTAAQTETQLTRVRDTLADAEYGAARDNAGAVDLTGAIGRIDQIMPRLPGRPEATAKGNLRQDSIEAILGSYRARMTDGRGMLSDYVAVERLRGDLADAVQAATQSGKGNRARLLGQVLREVDGAMEDASQGFRQANANYQNRSGVIDAIGEGRTAAMRGRSEDTLHAFRNMLPDRQTAFRSGYVDPLIADAQAGAFGANKARPLTSDAFRDEAATIAPGNDLMQRRLGREMRMFETRNHATGNSRTADNLADASAMSVDPSLLGNLLSGNWGTAARNALSASQNALTGNTPAVRQEVARMLTMRGGNVTPHELEQILVEAVDRVVRGQLIAGHMGRAAAGGLAIGDQRLGR